MKNLKHKKICGFSLKRQTDRDKQNQKLKKNPIPAPQKSDLHPPRMVLPAPLIPGEKAALIAPSFAVTPDQLAAAEESVRFLGLEPVIFPSCRSRADYLAGRDSLRAKDLEDAFADPAVRAVFCLRGGYGAARLLDLIDYECIRKNPKFFIGFSDITALHTVLNQKCGLITYHGPMPTAPYPRCDRRLTLFFLRRMLYGENFNTPLSIRLNKAEVLYAPAESQSAAGSDGKTRREMVMSGRLCGGNLTVLASALGTPYEIETEGKILFLEDVGERTYRIDRALSSLRLAGKLSRCSGILLGTFSGCGAEPSGRTCPQIIREIAEPLGIPVISGLPCGHSLPHLTLPMGADCRVFRITELSRGSFRHPVNSDYLVLRLSFG